MPVASSISVFWLIPWGVICIVLAYFLYSKSDWFSNLNIYWKITLRFCRALLFFLLGVLIFDFVFELIESKKEKPILITIVDNSSSINNYKDSNTVLKNIVSAKKAIRKRFKNKYDIVEMTTGDFPRYQSNISLSESKTNLESVFSKVATDYYNQNIGGLVLISDGNFNHGSNPLYNTSKLNYSPIYTLGVGDTVLKRDHYIKNLSFNEVTFLGNKFPIEVDLEAIKFKANKPYKVTIKKNNKTVASQNVVYQNEQRDFKQLSFLLNAEQTGFQRYTVSVSEAENEINYENNVRDFYVEIIDSRSKILILSSAPHPDISSVKEVLKSNKNVEIISKLISDWDNNLSGVDLIVWHKPSNGFNPSIANRIMENKKPVLFILGSDAPSEIINQLGLGIKSSNFKGKDDIQASFNMEFSSFELNEGFVEYIENVPPLNSRFSKISITKPLDVLLHQRIGSIKKKEPLVYFLKKSALKYGVIYGEGLWRWKINEFKDNSNIDFYKEILEKTCNYLLIKSNDSPLRLSFPEKFNMDEDIIVNASFYNASMEAITTSKINLKLTNDNNEEFDLQFSVYNDAYKLNMGTLKPGSYTWRASTVNNGKKHLKSGRFIVQNIGLESRDTYANHSLLKELSKESGGSFNLINNHHKMLNDIRARKDISTVMHKNSSFINLIDYKWIFFLLVFLVSLEWFGRKINGAY